MPQTLARVLVHVVFSTKDRRPSLKEQIRPNLFAYMAGILRSLAAYKYMSVGSSEPVIVNGVSDHVHILLTAPAAVALADIMRVEVTQ